MSRSKKLCVLLGILAAVCSATLIVLQVEERREQIWETGEIILELPWESVTALSWEHGGESLSFHRDETWLYDGDGAFPVSEERICELLEPFVSLGASFIIEDVEDFGQYGLDDPDLTVTVDYTAENEDGDEEEGTFVLHVSRDQETKRAAEEADTLPAYVRVGDSRIVYEISGDRYEELMAASCDDLWHREVFWTDFGQVCQIGVSLEGADYTITSEQDGEERVWSYQEEKVDTGNLQSALASLTADSFTSERPTEKEEIRLTLSLENESFPEVSIALYRYDREHCLAVVDGESVSLVARSAVVDLIEAVHAIVLG